MFLWSRMVCKCANNTGDPKGHGPEPSPKRVPVTPLTRPWTIDSEGGSRSDLTSDLGPLTRPWTIGPHLGPLDSTLDHWTIGPDLSIGDLRTRPWTSPQDLDLRTSPLDLDLRTSGDNRNQWEHGYYNGKKSCLRSAQKWPVRKIRSSFEKVPL